MVGWYLVTVEALPIKIIGKNYAFATKVAGSFTILTQYTKNCVTSSATYITKITLHFPFPDDGANTRRTLIELNYQRPVYRNYRLLSNGSLLIEHAGEEDEAKFMCEADNGVNEPLVKIVSLKINGKKMFKLFNEVLVVATVLTNNDGTPKSCLTISPYKSTFAYTLIAQLHVRVLTFIKYLPVINSAHVKS